MKDGKEVGTRLPPFSYSNQVLESIDDYDELIQKEIRRVKGLNREFLFWKTSYRPEGSLYFSDPISVLKNVGKKKVEALSLLESILLLICSISKTAKTK